jgi:hypothetical protein
MRNFLSLILIIVVIAGIFFVFQKAYTPVENDINTNQNTEEDQDDQAINSDTEPIKPPSNILFTEETPFYPVDDPAEGTGSVYLKHNSTDLYELNIAADLPQPEDEVYVAWLTGGIMPDTYVYLGKLEVQNYMGYGLIYKITEIPESLLAFHVVIISLEEKSDTPPTKPSNIKLRADFR